MAVEKERAKERKGVSKFFASRRGAFRGFKKDYDIPNAEQPKKVISSGSTGGDYYDLDERNKRLYIFEEKTNIAGKVKRKEAHLREDKDAFYKEGQGSQEAHFNAGFSEGKLRDHYYFKKKKKATP